MTGRKIDDAALLRLLWRGDDTPSIRSGLSVGAVVRAGVEIADEHGVDGLTMRRVAERLGVGAMSLYTYVPGKRELVALMVDLAMGEIDMDGGSSTTWRDDLSRMADEHWELYRRHPWLLDVPLSRPVVGPNVLDLYERQLRIVDGLGLDDHEMDAAIELVVEHVTGAANRSREIARDTDRSDLTDDEWWYSIAPTLNQVLTEDDYPLSSRVGEAIGAPHLDTSMLLNFGLDRILDGLQHLIDSRR